MYEWSLRNDWTRYKEMERIKMVEKESIKVDITQNLEEYNNLRMICKTEEKIGGGETGL